MPSALLMIDHAEALITWAMTGGVAPQPHQRRSPLIMPDRSHRVEATPSGETRRWGWGQGSPSHRDEPSAKSQERGYAVRRRARSTEGTSTPALGSGGFAAVAAVAAVTSASAAVAAAAGRARL